MNVVIVGSRVQCRHFLREGIDELPCPREGSVDTLLCSVDHVLDIEDILPGLFEFLHLSGIHRHVPARVNRHAPCAGQLLRIVSVRADLIDALSAL